MDEPRNRPANQPTDRPADAPTQRTGAAPADRTPHDQTRPVDTRDRPADEARLSRRDRKRQRKASAAGAGAGVAATAPSRAAAHERFGGTNIGAAFFGWLVAVGVAIILIGIVGAIGTAVGATNGLTFDGATDAASDASSSETNTFGLFGAIVVALILAIGYFAGGYVAGRMSRFDGARQGLAVWVIGLLVTILAGVLGAVAGREYDVLDRVELPSLSLTTDDLTLAGVIAGVVVLLVTALAAIAGGAAGRRYHDKVDRVAGTLG